MGPGAGHPARRGGLPAGTRRAPAADAADGRAGDVHRRGGRRPARLPAARADARLRLFVGHARGRRRRRAHHGHRPDRRPLGSGRVDQVRGPDHRRQRAGHHGRRVERALHPDRRRRHHRAGPGVVDSADAGADGGDRQRDELRRRPRRSGRRSRPDHRVGDLHLLGRPAARPRRRRAVLSARGDLGGAGRRVSRASCRTTFTAPRSSWATPARC